MLVSLRNSSAGYREGWAGAGGWACLSLEASRGSGRPAPGVLWALPASPGMELSHPGCFLCALKTIFALSGMRKKYSDMVEKRYLHTLVGRKGERVSL